MIHYDWSSDTTYPNINVEDGTGLPITYEEFVCALVKERNDVAKNLEHMVIGICGEAGEIADCIKKHTIYGKELDRANAIEELGDLEFYMAGMRQMLGLKRDEILAANVEKLRARYPKGEFSDQAAQDRADKQQPKLQVIDMSAPAISQASLAESKEQAAPLADSEQPPL